MPTTATLAIEHFRTTLTVDRDGQRIERINVFGENSDGDWDRNPVGFFRNAADRILRLEGYERADGWTYDASRDQHAATIKPAN